MSTQALTPTATLALSSDPTIPTVRVGDLYFNTGTGKLRVYGTSSAWVDVATSSGGGTPATTVVASNFFSQGSAVGTATNYAREDHVHGTPAFPTDMMTTDTTQTGMTGDKTSSGIWKAGVLAVAGLTGVTSATRYVGGVITGAPLGGTFVTGDWVVARDGRVWICTTGGSPGTWADAGIDTNSLHLSGTESITGTKTYLAAYLHMSAFSNTVNPASAGTPTVDSTSLQFNTKLWNGSSSVTESSGIIGERQSATAGDFYIRIGGTGKGTKSERFQAIAAGFNARLVGGTNVGAPTIASELRDIAVDSTGRIWVCTVAGTPGTWVASGSTIAPPTAITTTTTATDGAAYLATGTFTVTVPVANNTRVTIKNVGTGTITVAPASGTIDNAAFFTISALASISTVSDGTNVWII